MTQQGVVNLASYKYKAGGYSPMDRLLNPFWAAVTKPVPASISPNMVTLVGFVFAFSGMVAQILKQFWVGSEPWMGLEEDEMRFIVNLYTASCFFMYQTLDAVDGKHARATGQSTPLGALFDHGIDGSVMNIMGIVMLVVMWGDEESNCQASAGILSIFSGASFFFSQWGHYHTGSLNTQGVTECQYFTMAWILLVGSVSWFQKFLLTKTAPAILQIPGFFRACFREDSCYKVPSTALEHLLPFTFDFSDQKSFPLISANFVDLKGLMFCLSTLLPALVVLASIVKVIFPGEGEKPVGAYAYDNLGRPVATIFPYLCHMAQSLALILFCPRLWKSSPLLIIAVTGTGTVYMNLRIIVSGLCSLRFPPLIRMAQPFAAFALGAVFIENPTSNMGLSKLAGLVGAEISESRIEILYSEYGRTALIAMLIFQVLAIFSFAQEVISVICCELKIPFLAPLKKAYVPLKKST
jgi:hypothetical protein